MAPPAFQSSPVNQLAAQILRRAGHDPLPDQPAAIQALRLALDPEAGGGKLEIIPRLRERAEAECQALFLIHPAQAQAWLDRAELDLTRLAQTRTLAEFAVELLEQLLTTWREAD